MPQMFRDARMVQSSYYHAEYSGAGASPLLGAKYFYVCFFVCLTHFLNDEVCAYDFATKTLIVEKVLISLDRRRFIAVTRIQHCLCALRRCHYRMLKLTVW